MNDTVDLLDLAQLRVAELPDLVDGTGGGNISTLDALLARLFDRDDRELLTYSAFGSSL